MRCLEIEIGYNRYVFTLVESVSNKALEVMFRYWMYIVYLQE